MSYAAAVFPNLAGSPEPKGNLRKCTCTYKTGAAWARVVWFEEPDHAENVLFLDTVYPVMAFKDRIERPTMAVDDGIWKIGLSPRERLVYDTLRKNGVRKSHSWDIARTYFSKPVVAIAMLFRLRDVQVVKTIIAFVERAPSPHTKGEQTPATLLELVCT